MHGAKRGFILRELGAGKGTHMEEQGLVGLRLEVGNPGSGSGPHHAGGRKTRRALPGPGGRECLGLLEDGVQRCSEVSTPQWWRLGWIWTRWLQTEG